jgi:hypothetical protein
MGGFAVENDYLDEKDKRVAIRRIFTADGFLQLARLCLMPEIDAEDIRERSKSDNVVKLFALSQITWFALQVIGRLASSLPVTPLELHTAIHVACTILMYLLWMKKPYDVRNSMLLESPDVKAITALFNFCTVTSELHSKAHAEYETARVKYWQDHVVRATNNILDHDPPPSPPVKEPLTNSCRAISFMCKRVSPQKEFSRINAQSPSTSRRTWSPDP